MKMNVGGGGRDWEGTLPSEDSDGQELGESRWGGCAMQEAWFGQAVLTNSRHHKIIVLGGILSSKEICQRPNPQDL